MEDDDSGALLEISRDTENKWPCHSFFDGMVTLSPGPMSSRVNPVEARQSDHARALLSAARLGQRGQPFSH